MKNNVISILIFIICFSVSSTFAVNHQHADSYRKPGQVQLIDYQLPEGIEPFDPIDLDLVIQSYLPYETAQLSLTVMAEDGLELTKDPIVLNAKSWRLQFRAKKQGRLYLNVYVKEKNTKNIERFIPKIQQIFSIPIQVGDEV